MEFAYFVLGLIAGATAMSMFAVHEMNKLYNEFERMLDDIRKTEEK